MNEPGAKSPSCLIDASIYIFQYYFSLPPNWQSSDGFDTEAVYGFATFLLKIKEQYGPKRVGVCFDESLGSSFREEIYPQYKSSRALPDEALAFQLNACRQLAELMGLACFSHHRYEADDLLGCLMSTLRRSSKPVAILTRDKDLGQLIRRPQDYLWDFSVDKKSYRDDIYQKWGVWPEQMADYLALVGDSIDDIPGVPGIGAKTAAALLRQYDNLEMIFANLENLEAIDIRGSKTLAPKLEQHITQLAMAKTLATIVTDLPLIDSVTELNWGKADQPKLEFFCFEMGFPRLYSRMKKVLA